MTERFVKYVLTVLFTLVFFSDAKASSGQEVVLTEVFGLWASQPQELSEHSNVMQMLRGAQSQAIAKINQCASVREDIGNVLFGMRVGLSLRGPLRFCIKLEENDDIDFIHVADGLLALFAAQPGLLEAAVVREILLACFEPLDGDPVGARFNNEINKRLNLLDTNYLLALKQAFCRVNCATLVQASLQKKQENWWKQFKREDQLWFLVRVVDRFFEQREDLGNLMDIPCDVEVGKRVAGEIAIIDFAGMSIDDDRAIAAVCVALDNACAAPSPTVEQQVALRHKQHESYGKCAMADLIASFGQCFIQ